jgi:predicted dehydrogenase
MAIAKIDAEQMIEVERSTDKKLYIVKQNRYNPPVIFIKKLLEENKLGKILSFQLNCFWNRTAAYYDGSWKGTLKLDGGILYTQFSHFIDLLYWYLGNVKIVKGIRHNYLHKDCLEFEDSGTAFFQMENDTIGSINYTINANEKNMEGSLTLFGEKGTVKVGGQYLNELEYFSVQGEKLPELPKGNPANEYGFYQGSMSNHDKVYENLIKALKDPSHPFIDAAEAIKSVEIIEKIYEASPLLP